MVLTDGGLETVLLFEEGVELPCFAAFPLLDSRPGSRRSASVLRAVSAAGACSRHRVCAFVADVAGQPGLG